MLRIRQLIPPLTIRTIAGRNVQAWDYKQKKNLVIVFLHAGCASCEDFLVRLSSRAGDLKEKEAAALFVYLETPRMPVAATVSAEIVVGADMSGRSQRAYIGEDAVLGVALGVFVADRYGELNAQWIVGADHQFPGTAEIVSWLEHIELACEECGVSHWRAEA